MYKGLFAAVLAATFAYYLYSFPDFRLSLSYPTHSNTSSISQTIPPAEKMALASISRSVVQKVLAVETPEVRRADLLLMIPRMLRMPCRVLEHLSGGLLEA